MAAFSKTDIAFIRSQFNRLDRENFGSLDVPAIKRAVEYCWVVAGLKDKPQPQEIESAFQAHQQNQRVNLSQFILVLQLLKTRQRNRRTVQTSESTKWDTVKRGGVSTAKRVGRFFGVSNDKVEGAPSDMEIWKFKMEERAKAGDVGVKGVGLAHLTSTLHRKQFSSHVDQSIQMDLLYDNQQSSSLHDVVLSDFQSQSQHTSPETVQVDVHSSHIPSQPAVQGVPSIQAVRPRAVVSAPELQPITQSGEQLSVQSRHGKESQFISDAKEAMAYYRRRVREEEEEKRNKEEWFGYDQQNLLESTTERKQSRGDGAKKVDTLVRIQLESLPSFFPIFVILVSVGQLIAFGVTAYLGGFAPIGFGAENMTDVFSSPEPPYEKNFTHQVSKNLWIGPDARYLIHVGAKFTPCMRKDHKIFSGYAALLDVEASEGGYGCCVLDLGYRSGIYSTQDKCAKYEGAFKPGLTCKAYAQWSSDSVLVEFRPCCTTITGQCTLTSKDLCDFYEGTYFQDKENCSEVNCLSGVCGMGGLSSDETNPYLPSNPSQGWRFVLPLLFHTGVIHLAAVIVLQLLIGWNIEKTAGWFRVLLIYFLSGVGGYIVSGIFVPYQPTVGASPSVFGLLGVLVVELFQSWQLIERKLWAVIKLSLLILLFLMIGTLPYVDNFAHLGGFCFGIVAGVIFLPYITFGKWDARRKRILLIIAIPGLIFMYIIGLVVFYVVQNTNFCPNCKYVNCIPYTSSICEDAFASPDPDNVAL